MYRGDATKSFEVIVTTEADSSYSDTLAFTELTVIGNGRLCFTSAAWFEQQTRLSEHAVSCSIFEIGTLPIPAPFHRIRKTILLLKLHFVYNIPASSLAPLIYNFHFKSTLLMKIPGTKAPRTSLQRHSESTTC